MLKVILIYILNEIFGRTIYHFVIYDLQKNKIHMYQNNVDPS